MRSNVGVIDRIIRIITGLGTLDLFFWVQGKERLWGLLGLIPLFTGIMGLCPFYVLIGFKTCPLKDENDSSG